MVEEIFPDIYRMEIPLPDSPLRAINAYLIKGNGRYLMIDTGMNRPECREAMDMNLKVLDVDLAQTDFFITHLHADHFGLVSDLAGPSSKIYFNEPDARIVNTPGIWDKIIDAALANGFPEEAILSVMKRHPGRLYQQQGPLNLTLLKDGDRLAMGGYVFTCVETPGHTRGHLCLYEVRTKIFFSGDHILGDITPNIILWDESENPLQRYLESLDKVERMDISVVFPGHRRVVTDHRRRIGELRHHHELRAAEILGILRERSGLSAYQIASRMSWDIDCDTWEDFPVPQKWFATGEALSHLIYMHVRQEVRRERVDGRVLFFGL